MTQGRPTAAPAYFPYKHDSMAVVMAAEELDRNRRRVWDRKRYLAERKREVIA